MSLALTAGLWGLLGASSLIAGAAVAFLLKMPRTVAAGIMSFGCGVLISAVTYDLLEDGFGEGGIWPIVGAHSLDRSLTLSPTGSSPSKAAIAVNIPATSRERRAKEVASP